jgi:alcohol dehydrogenase (NADP+)
MASITTHKLNTGAAIPAIGFGTWQDKDDQEKAVTEALKAGFLHIDTARSKFFFCPTYIRAITN